jgi:hypothetical protein
MSFSKTEFQNLPNGEKAAYVINNGRHISSINTKNNFANLFVVDHLLVEVRYDGNENKISSIEIIEDSEMVDRYIDSAYPGLSEER